MKKVRLLVFALIMAFSCVSFAGCNLNDGEQVDKTKTQLYVNNFEGGFGDEWLRNVKVRFEAAYADKEYESGKRGVQIIIDPNNFGGDALKDKMGVNRGEVYFSEHVYIHDFVAKGHALEITDIVTENMSAKWGENKTIESKLTAEQKAYYGVKDAGGSVKYYGIPHYANYSGIVCDVDMFEEWDLFYKAASATDGRSDGFVNKASGDTLKSAGPDGELHTGDDGFPATYEEFFGLCDRIYNNGGQPIIWAGFSQEDYVQLLMSSLHADYEGLDQMMLNYTFSGYADTLVNSISGGTVSLKGSTEIRNDNGYEVFSQAGRYYATDFVKRLFSDTNYYDKNDTSNVFYHTDAQSKYLRSVSPDNSYSRVAMLIDGSWWMNEANSVFKTMEARDPDMSKMNRKFTIMPMPKATPAKVGTKQTLLDTHQSLGFISAYIDDYKVQLAKDFLQFCSTDESLVEYTVTTNSVKALNYDLSDAQKSQLSYYGKTLLEAKNASDIVYPYSQNTMYLDDQNTLAKPMFQSKPADGAVENRPIEALLKSSTNAVTFFEGYKINYQSTWSGKYGTWF